MRLISTRRLTAGMALGEDVRVGPADVTPLLRAGTTLTPTYIKSLLDHGFNAVYIDDSVSAGIVVPRAMSPELKAAAAKTVAKAMASLKELNPKEAGLGDREVAELTSIAALIAEQVAGSAEVGMALVDLSSVDGHVYDHSVNVTALGLLLGDRLLRTHGYKNWEGKRSFDGIQMRLVRLGVGLLLHDIGKLGISSAIVEKTTPLTAEEAALLQTHTQLGSDMLRSDTVTPLVKSVIRSHHERWDGSGYPDGKLGEEINQLARVAAVANAYDAAVSEGPRSPATSSEVGWRTVVAGSGTAFDPLVVDMFREVVAPWPIGTEILLSDGQRAVVASVPKGHLDRPAIRLIAIGDDGQERAGAELALLDRPDLDVVGSATYASEIAGAAVASQPPTRLSNQSPLRDAA